MPPFTFPVPGCCVCLTQALSSVPSRTFSHPFLLPLLQQKQVIGTSCETLTPLPSKLGCEQSLGPNPAQVPLLPYQQGMLPSAGSECPREVVLGWSPPFHSRAAVVELALSRAGFIQGHSRGTAPSRAMETTLIPSASVHFNVCFPALMLHAKHAASHSMHSAQGLLSNSLGSTCAKRRDLADGSGDARDAAWHCHQRQILMASCRWI